MLAFVCTDRNTNTLKHRTQMYTYGWNATHLYTCIRDGKFFTDNTANMCDVHISLPRIPGSVVIRCLCAYSCYLLVLLLSWCQCFC